jgi:hypothetical protein
MALGIWTPDGMKDWGSLEWVQGWVAGMRQQLLYAQFH